MHENALQLIRNLNSQLCMQKERYASDIKLEFTIAHVEERFATNTILEFTIVHTMQLIQNLDCKVHQKRRNGTPLLSWSRNGDLSSKPCIGHRQQQGKEDMMNKMEIMLVNYSESVQMVRRAKTIAEKDKIIDTKYINSANLLDLLVINSSIMGFDVWLYLDYTLMSTGFFGGSEQKREAPPGEKPEPVRTHLRNMITVPEVIGSIIGVYNGKTFSQVEIKSEMISHYLAEFSISYLGFVQHTLPG
ncbi:hypothetical protein SADUNF_Sadunf13G0035000 [Salix dunnii]|uniref:40S ribosomal protein S15 n=1 Tax=Salix dunnii TaxID=1413687 RepID=A0A835MLJ9_9ROSI|nr:hypothetical protein SADUNF_Sadunf13G0035000 [Salix dunnii]